MNILIANDDGISAPGLEKLAAAALKFGKVWVAAPASQCSGMSHKLTIFQALPVEEVPYPVPVEKAWKIGGTPADCVKTAITALMPVRPDIVLSGINNGLNAGYDIAYSGTIGAAMESLLNDVPAIAVSNVWNADYLIVDAHLEAILAELLQRKLPENEIWNVNFPEGICRGIRRDVTIAPMDLFKNYYTMQTSESGAQVLKPGADMVTLDQTPEGSDLHAVLSGYIAIGRVRCAVK